MCDYNLKQFWLNHNDIQCHKFQDEKGLMQIHNPILRLQYLLQSMYLYIELRSSYLRIMFLLNKNCKYEYK